jgi:hypothetical protein
MTHLRVCSKNSDARQFVSLSAKTIISSLFISRIRDMVDAVAPILGSPSRSKQLGAPKHGEDAYDWGAVRPKYIMTESKARSGKKRRAVSIGLANAPAT